MNEEGRCCNPDCGKITRSHPLGFGFYMCHTCWETLPEPNRSDIIKKAIDRVLPQVPQFNMKALTEALEKEGLTLFEGNPDGESDEDTKKEEGNP